MAEKLAIKSCWRLAGRFYAILSGFLYLCARANGSGLLALLLALICRLCCKANDFNKMVYSSTLGDHMCVDSFVMLIKLGTVLICDSRTIEREKLYYATPLN